MIERLLPIQFDRRAATGRTGPAFVLCENGVGEEVEVVVKLAAQCDRSITSLAMEVVSACLAGDLGLPVPQPYLVLLEAQWVESIADAAWASSARASAPWAFGSKLVPPGFSTWITGTPMVTSLAATAAAVLTFDCLTDNTDRRAENPNCLQRGDEVRIIDHELCFPAMLIGWRPPWEAGSLQHLARPGVHIFCDALRGRDVDWGPVVAAWQGLSDGHLEDYENAVPEEWSDAAPAVRAAIDKIANARDHIEACIMEVQRVLRC